MAETPMIDRPFCGRDLEMTLLQRAFDRLSAPEPKPELMVILGESGLGKTRLVQQFYSWLSTQRDAPEPEGYWPDRMSADDGYAEVNPAQGCNGAAALPYLWLGIRCRDKLTDLETYVSALEPHLLPLEDARERQKVGFEWVEKWASSAVSLIPLVGPILVALWAHFKDGKKLVKAFKPHGPRAKRLAVAEEHRRLGSAATLIGLLGDVLDTPAAITDLKARGRQVRRLMARMKRVPAVIVIDDAQWARQSQALVVFVRDLLAAAEKGGWPLLILATHWEREWNEDLAADSAESFAKVAQGWAHARDPAWQPLRLRPQAGEIYAGIVQRALPGLTAPQRQAILERAGGNALLLEKIVDHARRNPGLFEDMDPGKALTPAGLAALSERDFQVHELVAERLQASPLNVRLAAALSAMQGMEFTRRVTVEAAERLGKIGAAEGLAQVENPQALVFPLAEGVYSFSQRAFHDVALRDLANVADAKAAQAAVLDSLKAQLADQPALDALPRAERNELRQTAAVLLARTGEEADRGQAAARWLELAEDAAQAWDAITTAAFVEKALEADPELAFLPAGFHLDLLAVMPRLVDAGKVELARSLADLGGRRWLAAGTDPQKAGNASALENFYKFFGGEVPDWIAQERHEAIVRVLSDAAPEAVMAAKSAADTQESALAQARAAGDVDGELDLLRDQLEQSLAQQADLAGSEGAPVAVLCITRADSIARFLDRLEATAPQANSAGRWTIEYRAQVIQGLIPLLCDLVLAGVRADGSISVRSQAMNLAYRGARQLSVVGDVGVIQPQLSQMRSIALESAREARSADMTFAAARILFCLCAAENMRGSSTAALQALTQSVILLDEAWKLDPRPEFAIAQIQALTTQDQLALETPGVTRPSPKVIAEAVRQTTGVVGEELKQVAGPVLKYWSTLSPEDSEIVGKALYERLQAAVDDSVESAWIHMFLGVLDGSGVEAEGNA